MNTTTTIVKSSGSIKPTTLASFSTNTLSSMSSSSRSTSSKGTQNAEAVSTNSSTTSHSSTTTSHSSSTTTSHSSSTSSSSSSSSSSAVGTPKIPPTTPAHIPIQGFTSLSPSEPHSTAESTHATPISNINGNDTTSEVEKKPSLPLLKGPAAPTDSGANKDVGPTTTESEPTGTLPNTVSGSSPTESNIAAASLSSGSSFFQNKAAVGGTFAGVALLVVLVLLAISCLRRRRQKNKRHWLDGIDQAVYASSFRDEVPASLLRSVHGTSSVEWSSRRNTAFSDGSRFSQSFGLGNPANSGGSNQSHSDPFSDHGQYAVNTNRADSPASRSSTPSIYPATLPAAEEDIDPFYAHEIIMQQARREQVLGTDDYQPITPPASVASSSHSTAPQTPPISSHPIAGVPRIMTSVFDQGQWDHKHSFTNGPPEELFMKRKVSTRIRSRTRS